MSSLKISLVGNSNEEEEKVPADKESAGGEEASSLAELKLKEKANLSKLTVRGLDGKVAPIAEALTKHPHIETLDVGTPPVSHTSIANCAITDEGATQLMAALQSNTALKTLCLSVDLWTKFV